jgi:hypothetical protein
MASTPTKIWLQKTLKEGLRRCVYRRWEAEVIGKVLATKTTDLERMYRGNTPYPIAKSPMTHTRFPTLADALSALRRRMTARRAQGYTPHVVGRREQNYSGS